MSNIKTKSNDLAYANIKYPVTSKNGAIYEGKRCQNTEVR